MSNSDSHSRTSREFQTKQILGSHIKSHRTCHRSVLDSISLLAQELSLLNQLWYKNHAQFRSAKWWKAIDSVRRCAKRIAGSQGKQSKASKLKELDSSHRGKLKAAAARKERPEKGWRDGQAWKALRASRNVWITMWNPDGIVEERNDIGNVSLPKLPDKPSHAPTSESLNELSLALQELLALLHELRLRSRHAWKILSAHLRTPPAPTFAPLCLLLLGLCSRLEVIARETSWGVQPSQSSESTLQDQKQAQQIKPKLGSFYRDQRASPSTVSSQSGAGAANAPAGGDVHSNPALNSCCSLLLTTIIQLTTSFRGAIVDAADAQPSTSAALEIASEAKEPSIDDRKRKRRNQDESPRKRTQSISRKSNAREADIIIKPMSESFVEEELKDGMRSPGQRRPKKKKRLGPFSSEKIKPQNAMLTQLLSSPALSSDSSLCSLGSLDDPFIRSSSVRCFPTGGRAEKRIKQSETRPPAEMEPSTSDKVRTSSSTLPSKDRKRGGARERRREKRSLQFQAAASLTSSKITARKASSDQQKAGGRNQGDAKAKVQKKKGKKRKASSLLDDDDLGEALER